MVIYFAIFLLRSSPVFIFLPRGCSCELNVRGRGTWKSNVFLFQVIFTKKIRVCRVDDEHVHFLAVGEIALLSLRLLMSDSWLKHTEGKLKDSTT